MNLNNFIRMFYVSLFVIAPVLSNKIMDLFGVTMPVGMFFVVLFMLGMIDVINYRLGIKEARQMILMAVIIKAIIYLVFIPIAIQMPYPIFWDNQETYTAFLHESVRMFIASELVILLGQYVFDTRIFAYFSKFNWFNRVLLSDFVSQAIQTTGMMLIKFWGTGTPILDLIISAYVLRMGLSLIKALILYPLAKAKGA